MEKNYTNCDIYISWTDRPDDASEFEDVSVTLTDNWLLVEDQGDQWGFSTKVIENFIITGHYTFVEEEDIDEDS